MYRCPRREYPPPNLCRRQCGYLDGRADHLEKVFAALHAYLAVIIADTAQNIPRGVLDRGYLDNLQDLSADAVGVIRTAAEEVREGEIGRVP
jgi:hypothetical protein